MSLCACPFTLHPRRRRYRVRVPLSSTDLTLHIGPLYTRLLRHYGTRQQLPLVSPFHPVALLLLGIVFVMFGGPSTTRLRPSQGIDSETVYPFPSGILTRNARTSRRWSPSRSIPIAIGLPCISTNKTVSQNRSIFANGKNKPATIWYSMPGSSVRIMRISGCSMETVARWGASGTRPGWDCLWQNRRRIVHARARVLDLTFDTFDEQHVPYREVAQSLMLLDRTRKNPCAPNRETRPSDPRRRTQQWTSSRPQDHGSGVTPCPWGMSAGRLSLPTPGHGHGWRILFRHRRQPLAPRSHD